MAPSQAQIALVVISAVALLIGWVCALLEGFKPHGVVVRTKRISFATGAMTAVGALGWHLFDRGDWLPADDNFDALLLLSLLLGAFTWHLQLVRPVKGIAWIMVPVMILVQSAAALFGTLRFQDYHVTTAWNWTHRISSYTGFVAFAIAFGCGVLYLIAHQRLRDKSMHKHGAMTSLERLESLTRYSVLIGFALLTVGIVTGIVEAVRRDNSAFLSDPKVLLGGGVWLVYALVLYAPINPSFRGRRSAVLSIMGFLLMIGALVASQLRGAS